MAENKVPTPTFPDPNKPPGWITGGDWEKPTGGGGSDPQLEQRVSDLEQTTEALGQSVTQNEGDIVDLQATAEEQGTEINGLKNVTIGLQNGQSNLSKRVSTLENATGPLLQISQNIVGTPTTFTITEMETTLAFPALIIQSTVYNFANHDTLAIFFSMNYQPNGITTKPSVQLYIPILLPKGKTHTAPSFYFATIDETINGGRFWATLAVNVAPNSSNNTITIAPRIIPHSTSTTTLPITNWKVQVAYIN